MIRLLATRRFGPIFVTQFLGAFNDNLFRIALLFLITFRLMGDDPQRAAAMVTLASGIFVLPFFLFSSTAGQMTDRLDKAKLVRIVKGAEIIFMLIGAAALLTQSIPLLFAVLFCMGLHSTVFGPVKYAILPQHLRSHEVVGGTALVEAGTFIAILFGQIAGGLFSLQTAAIGIIMVALLGAVSGWMVPPAPPTAVQSRFNYNPATSAWSQLREVFGDPVRGRAVLGISWFWGLGTVFTSELIPLVRNQLFAHETVATLLLTLFSVGIAVGSLGVGRLLRGRVSARHATAALIILALASLDLGYTIYRWQNLGDAATFAAFLQHPGSWRLIVDFTVFALAGGVFIVPLYAILQVASRADHRGQAVGANNIVNAAFQVSAALGAGALITAGWTPGLVLTTAGVTGLLMIPVLRPLAGDFGGNSLAGN